MIQQTLFDPAESQRRKEIGIDLVLQNPRTAEWQAEVMTYVMGMPRDTRFTAEDICLLFGEPPCHANTMGAIFRVLARKKFAEKIYYRPSNKKSRHGGVIRVWRRT